MKQIPQKTDKKSEVICDLRINQKYESIKLGIDWHARQFRVVRIVENAGPEPAQRFTPEKFLEWAGKQKAKAREVYSCYEAGIGGFVLHRQLEALGVKSYVIAPRNLDRRHKRVQNDATDARELALDLDRFVRGNFKAMPVVNVPSLEQEERRVISRQRLQMRSHRLSLAAQGRSLLMGQGHHQSNSWWKPRRWQALICKLPAWLVETLLVYRRTILVVDQEMAALARSLEKAAPAHRPKGMGALGLEELEREVCDWNRFKNPKVAGSYTGLTGGLSASGENSRDLSISKAGNRRLRAMLIEAAWRWVLYQSQSRQVQRWKGVLLKPGVHARARKRAIVAVARQLFVDLWRWRTGRATPEQMGWIMMG